MDPLTWKESFSERGKHKPQESSERGWRQPWLCPCRPAWPSSRWGLCPLWDRGVGRFLELRAGRFWGSPGVSSDHSLCAAGAGELPAQQAWAWRPARPSSQAGHSRLVGPPPASAVCVCVCVSADPSILLPAGAQPWRPNPIPFFQGNSEPDGAPAWKVVAWSLWGGRRQGDSGTHPQSLQACPEGEGSGGASQSGQYDSALDSGALCLPLCGVFWGS